MQHILCLEAKNDELKKVLLTFDALDLLSAMITEEIEADEVTTLDMDELKRMGITLGRSKRFLKKIQESSEGEN